MLIEQRDLWLRMANNVRRDVLLKDCRAVLPLRKVHYSSSHAPIGRDGGIDVDDKILCGCNQKSKRDLRGDPRLSVNNYIRPF